MSLIRFSDEIDDSGVEMMPTTTSLDYGPSNMGVPGNQRLGHTWGAKSEPFSVRVTKGASQAPVFDSYLSDESDCPFSTDDEPTNGTKPRRHSAQKSSSSNMGVVGGRKYLNRSLLGQGGTYDLETKVFVFPSTWTSKPKPKAGSEGMGLGNWSLRGRTFSSSTTSTVTSNRNCSRSRATTQKPEKIRRHESWIESLRGRMGRSKTPRDCEADPVRSSGSLPDDTGYWGEDDEVNRVCAAEVHQNTPKLVAGAGRHQLKHRQCKSELINFSRSDVTFVSEADGADTMDLTPPAQPLPVRQQQFFLPHHCCRSHDDPFADQNDSEDDDCPYY